MGCLGADGSEVVSDEGGAYRIKSIIEKMATIGLQFNDFDECIKQQM